MIDRQQAHLVEIDGFFERLHEAEAELAILSREAQSRSILMYSVGRGMSRWPGPTQWPTTPAPSMSATNS